MLWQEGLLARALSPGGPCERYTDFQRVGSILLFFSTHEHTFNFHLRANIDPSGKNRVIGFERQHRIAEAQIAKLHCVPIGLCWVYVVSGRRDGTFVFNHWKL